MPARRPAPARRTAAPPRTARARPSSGSDVGSGSCSGGTGKTRSAARRSGARLVTMICTPGDASRRSLTVRAASSELLEVVEHEQHVAGPRGARECASSSGLPPDSYRPSVCAIVGSSSAGSVDGLERDEPDAPLPKELDGLRGRVEREPRLSRAAGAGERDEADALSSSNACSASSSALRPTSGVACAGQVRGPVLRASAAAGTAPRARARRAGAERWGCVRSLSRCSPRSRVSMSTRSRVTCESTT